MQQAGLGEASGPFGVCHADPDGNEVDLVPGAALGESIATADWQTVFSAMACYRTTSPQQQRDLVAAAAALADDAGFPLLVDLRPGLVILDSGKDGMEMEAGVGFRPIPLLSINLSYKSNEMDFEAFGETLSVDNSGPMLGLVFTF